MIIFKFGGSSVKNAAGVRNVAEILRKYSGEELCIVLSAMGKTTNALEAVCEAFYHRTGEAPALLEQLREMHLQIAGELFPGRKHPVFNELENHFAELYWAIEEEQLKSFDYEYDQIVSVGELLSTRIVAAYLNDQGIAVQWTDARDLIRTDNTYREGAVDWEVTEKQIRSHLERKDAKYILTQGFIGGTSENFTTTLGREGSDYTAAILAFCTDAREVVIWKDVPGVLNADPKEFPGAVLIPELSYYDAIELAYYGATVIHPKTIKPLQNKNIPLSVRPFSDPAAQGTRISSAGGQQPIPTYIFKKQQVLLSLSPRDFSFIIEENIRDIFELFARLRIKVNMMQNSALNFSVCITADSGRFRELLHELESRFRVRYNEECSLVTIRNYTDDLIRRLSEGKVLLLEQLSRHTVQLVLQ